MREHFGEGDLIVAEIQQVGSFDGRIQVQTRNQKYGLLENGVFVKVDSNHIRRMKHHILEFFADPCIGCIIGTNGYIWIEAPRRKVEKGQESPPVTLAERQRIAALRNAIIMLDK